MNGNTQVSKSSPATHAESLARGNVVRQERQAVFGLNVFCLIKRTTEFSKVCKHNIQDNSTGVKNFHQLHQSFQVGSELPVLAVDSMLNAVGRQLLHWVPSKQLVQGEGIRPIRHIPMFTICISEMKPGYVEQFSNIKNQKRNKYIF